MLIQVCTTLTDPDKKVVDDNVIFAKKVCRAVCDAGHTPFAPHLLFTQFLRDEIPQERDAGIDMGLDVMARVDLVIFVLPPWRASMSKGMRCEMDAAEKMGKTCLVFATFEEFTEHFTRILVHRRTRHVVPA